MKKVILSMVFAVLAFVFSSCDKEPGEPVIKPHDPNDIGGVYGVNYEIFIDDDVRNETEDMVFGRYQTVGWPFASVEVREDGEQSRIVFNPYPYDLRFDSARGAALDIWSMLEMVKDEAGNYRFEAPGTYGGIIQREVTFSGIPDLHSLVGVTVDGSIVRRSEKRDWVSIPDHIAPPEETTDMYYDLDMTVELTPLVPDGDFEKMVIKITSR